MGKSIKLHSSNPGVVGEGSSAPANQVAAHKTVRRGDVLMRNDLSDMLIAQCTSRWTRWNQWCQW
ncbi:hypothetical protein KSP39_PZI011050 [Platanthera zijinensis]|uniref:Uncharacterized protein n=1 Tax=Platanthera zijinensis TaxID=2320716 RepID=A0AAP0BIK9_9ASPA